MANPYEVCDSYSGKPLNILDILDILIIKPWQSLAPFTEARDA